MYKNLNPRIEKRYYCDTPKPFLFSLRGQEINNLFSYTSRVKQQIYNAIFDIALVSCYLAKKTLRCIRNVAKKTLIKIL